MRKSFYLFLFLQIVIASNISAQNAPVNFKNPVIPGFHPDPSICKVGDDYYLVNSSFEWYPGLPVFHSKDLVNWNLISYAIHRPNQVELPVGLKNSRGLYAPTIHEHNGTFYIINTCVNCKGNFYVTATNPAGPWSDPIWTNTHGIDPSLFWDDDGRSYYIGHGYRGQGPRQWDAQEGIWMQEIDLKTGKMLGEMKQLTHGHASNARWTEGPHLYKINGKYLLMVAEGGTGFHHAITVFNSDKLWGPYVPNHANPVLTHRNLGKDYPIHSVGHADLIQTQNGEWWAVMLGKRLVDGKTLLARETFLAPLQFEEQEGQLTPVFNVGIGKVQPEMKRPNLPWSPFTQKPARDNFESCELALEWNFLRTPYTQWYKIEKGNLNIQLRPEILDSLVNPSYIARRIQHHKFTASTAFSFKSKKANEIAGMSLYRSNTNHVTFTKQGNELVLIRSDKKGKTEIGRKTIKSDKLVLKVVGNNTKAAFYFGENEQNMSLFAENVAIDTLCDELALGFSGPYVGMYASSNGVASKNIASFDWFEYVGL
jgi:xylan 1,4-beta-xylosidase